MTHLVIIKLIRGIERYCLQLLLEIRKRGIDRLNYQFNKLETLLTSILKTALFLF